MSKRVRKQVPEALCHLLADLLREPTPVEQMRVHPQRGGSFLLDYPASVLAALE